MKPTVFIVDDDQAVRNSLVFLFESEEIAVEAYSTANDFLAGYQTDHPGCLVLDIKMPGMSGLELQQTLVERQIKIPTIFITGHGDVPMSVRAIKAGALDFIEKPIDSALLLSHVREAIVCDLSRREEEISAAKQTQTALFDGKERAQMTLHSIGDAVITTDANGAVVYLNPIAERLTGWIESEARDRPIEQVFNIINEDSREPIENLVSRCLQYETAAAVCIEQLSVLIGRHGQELAVEDTITPIRGDQGELLGTVIVFRDVTQQRRTIQALAHDAVHDPLTGLVNRREFEKRLEHSVAGSKAQGTQHALCYIDLDQFKLVNDTAGHAAGDELLRQVASLFMEQVRERDTLARLGGDEFALLLANCPLDKAYEIAEALVAELRDYRFVWQGQPYKISASIGLFAITGTAESALECLSQADAACYSAKELGRNRVHVYQLTNADQIHRQKGSMSTADLSRLLEQQRFLLYSQPIVSLVSGGGIAHHELLVRLLDAEGEVVMPGAFVSLAERHGLMAGVDRWVIHAAFQGYREIFPGAATTKISINLSSNSFNDDSLLDFVRQQFSESAIPPEQVCFEFTETVAIQHLNQVGRFISGLKKLGCHFTLDNFSSDISSFSYLKKLPVDYVKINGRLVQNMLNSPVDFAMVEAINKIGHTMGVRTIAEWVESDALVSRLTDLGIDYAQGFAIHSPRPLEASRT